MRPTIGSLGLGSRKMCRSRRFTIPEAVDKGSEELVTGHSVVVRGRSVQNIDYFDCYQNLVQKTTK